MCIFTSKVQRIANTKIFVASTNDRSRQLTVVSNHVRLAGKNRVAMVIPVPVDPLQENGGIVLHDFSSYKHIFNDLESFFPETKPEAGSKNHRIKSLERELVQDPFGVFDVDAVADFDELKSFLVNSSIEINPYVTELFASNYSCNFGFVICKIQKSARFYPIAFSSPMLLANQYYVPTYFFDGSDFDMKPNWDHEIYALNRKRLPMYQPSIVGIISEDSQIKGKPFELKTKKVANRMPKVVVTDSAITIWRTRINNLFKENVNIMYRLFRIEASGRFDGV